MPGQAPPLTGERELLLAYLVQQRDGIRNGAYGHTDDQARLTPTARSLSPLNFDPRWVERRPQP